MGQVIRLHEKITCLLYYIYKEKKYNIEWVSKKNSYLIKKYRGKMIIDKFGILIISIKLF